jgi:transposase
MLSKNNPQIDVLTQMIYDKLVPKDHLLVKIDSNVDFSFVYKKVEKKYSDMGRSSKDPAMMVKIMLLEYLYKLSDVEVAKRISSDIVFRWFLGLNIDDKAPDDTTISHFRIKRLGKEDFEEFFNEIVKQCIDKNLVSTNRFLIDSTNVDTNASLPFGKKLIRDAYRKVSKEITKFDEDLAGKELASFEEDIDKEYESGEKVDAKKHYEIALKHLERLYVETYDELQQNESYQEAFRICYEIADRYLHKKSDKIVSVVDPDARTGYKTRRKAKIGYKDHILVDEDSEIILASTQTTFNVGDEKELKDLLEKAETNFGIKPDEVTADKAYGTDDNRVLLKDSGIVSNIAFYEEPEKKNKTFGIRDFDISEDLQSITCPNGITSHKYSVHEKTQKAPGYIQFKFDKKDCNVCPLRDECLPVYNKGKRKPRFRRVNISVRYDARLRDLKRVKTPEFEEAYRNRFKVERRFATMVANHGLRRSRYMGLARTSVHIIMANMASNIIRMVNLLCNNDRIAAVS